MQLTLALTVLTVASVFAECNVGMGDAQRLCKLEQEMTVVQNALQELLQRADINMNENDAAVAAVPEKRKNEFIRFGKRKNEFIRFGKRKNEFIRFGRSDPALHDDDYSMEKRKNEFIRFG